MPPSMGTASDVRAKCSRPMCSRAAKCRHITKPLACAAVTTEHRIHGGSRQAVKIPLMPPPRARFGRSPLAVLALMATCILAVDARTGRRGNEIAVRDELRLDSLAWTFVRIRYQAWPSLDSQYKRNYWSAPWAIDAPAAEQNLSRRVRSLTAIDVAEPIVLTLDDPQLWTHPWIYFVEPGTMNLTDAEVSVLREFLLRGGTATFDDFHGPVEWTNLQQQIRRVFPDRPIVELAITHPVFHSFYQIDAFPQVAGLGSFLAGRTWEKAGYTAKLRAVQDDAGRAMVLINWNTDMGDGWEWSNAEEYPGYLKFTKLAYRMMINEIIYSLTH
jgi:hypothetical protein